MKRLLTAAILLASIFTQAACAESNETNSSSSTRSWTNVSYSNLSATDKLDIFLPATGDGPFPVVIWIHGGAFKMGSKSNPQSLTALNNAGFAVVSIDYRLSSEAIWPAQLNDLKDCVKFLKTNAATYSLNPNKMASWGASAGAHLSLMIGAALATDPATRIQAAVSWFPPMHFYYQDEDMALSGVSRCTGANGDANSPESALIGAQVSTHKALCDAASPMSYVDTMNVATPLPNFLLMHGGKDCNIGANQSVRFNTAVTNRFGASKSQYIFLANGTHGGGDFTLSSSETTVINFLKAQLMTTTAVNAPKSATKMNLSYNKSNKSLVVNELDVNFKLVNYMLFNTAGIILKQGILSNNTIHVSGLNGIYVIKLQSENEYIGIQKVLIN